MRSALKCIKVHSGCYSCERCIVCGVYDKQMRHVFLTDLSCRPRTNNSFLLQHDKDHHLGSSVLTETGVEMVTGFVLDYMHMSCLGRHRRRRLERYPLQIRHKQDWGRGFILLLLQTVALPESDAGSGVIKPASSFVIQNRQTSCSMWCPMYRARC